MMKIFLNERFISFVASKPHRITETDLFIVYDSPSSLKNIFELFESDPTYRTLFIQDQNDTGFSEASISFLSLFKIVEASGGVVKNEKNEILFIHRSGFWDLPKGKISNKDRQAAITHTSTFSRQPISARLAAIREVKEETGLCTVSITKELASTWHIYYIKQKRILKHTHWFEMVANSSQPLIPQTEEDILLVRWVPPEELDTIRGKTFASLRELF